MNDRFTFVWQGCFGRINGDALLREWTEKLGAYMETCELLPGTQDGVLRTESEAEEEAERYSYETLRRGR